MVDWLLGHVTHLPSDLECQKALMAPRLSDKDILPQRSKCLELIMRVSRVDLCVGDVHVWEYTYSSNRVVYR